EPVLSVSVAEGEEEIVGVAGRNVGHAAAVAHDLGLAANGRAHLGWPECRLLGKVCTQRRIIVTQLLGRPLSLDHVPRNPLLVLRKHLPISPGSCPWSSSGASYGRG